MIIEILRQTPVWVWPLLALLPGLGWLQTRRRRVCLPGGFSGSLPGRALRLLEPRAGSVSHVGNVGNANSQ